MLTIYYREASEPAAGSAPNVTTLGTSKQLAKARDMLTPEQRCDAVYADWLVQLNGASHPALLQIRNLLIVLGVDGASDCFVAQFT